LLLLPALFSFSPNITLDQFFSNDYLDLKVNFLLELAQVVKQKDAELLRVRRVTFR
jgi:hypothetical protein